jgi:hypothetical protein
VRKNPNKEGTKKATDLKSVTFVNDYRKRSGKNIHL